MAKEGRAEGHAAAHDADIYFNDACQDLSSAARGDGSGHLRKHVGEGCIPGVIFGSVLVDAVD